MITILTLSPLLMANLVSTLWILATFTAAGAAAAAASNLDVVHIHKVENLLPKIADQHFPACNLVIAHDNHEIDKLDPAGQTDLTAVSTSTVIGTNNLTFTQTIHSLLQSLFSVGHGRDLYLVNYMSYNVTKRSNSSAIQAPYPSALGGTSKHRPNCFLTMIFIENVHNSTFEQLFKLLTPPVYELTKKDEDHYLIISKDQFIDQILLSKQFTMRIQYKLAMFYDSTQMIQFKTVCFYCKPGLADKEKIVPVELNLGSNVFPSKKEFFPEVVRNLNGHQMRVVCPSGTHQQARLKQLPNGDWVPMRGSYFFAMDNLVRVFNFTYSVRPSTLGGTGLQQPNGTWIGTVGDILHDRADMGLVTAITYQRYKFIGYNYPITWEWLTFGTAIPVSKFTWEALFWPFSKELWTGLLVSLVIMGVIFACLQKHGRTLPEHKVDSTLGEYRISDTSTYVWGTLLDQSLNFPKSNPLKILVIFWLFLVLIVGTGYRSKLVTCLAFPVVEPPPTTFTELANSGYKVGLCYVGGAAYNVFKTSTDPSYIKLYKVMELFKDMTECFVRTLNQRVSCIGYESMASYVLNKNLTDRYGRPRIQVPATASTFFVGCGYVITKRAIFRPNFDHYIMTWMDMGLLGQWRKIDHENVRRQKVKWEIETEQDRGGGGGGEDEGPAKLNVENLKVVFILLVLGVLAGLIALITEILNDMGRERVFGGFKRGFDVIDRALNKIR